MKKKYFFRWEKRNSNIGVVTAALRLTRRRSFVPLLLLSLLIPLFAFMPSASALQGEKFTWVDQYTIRISGGDLKAPATMKAVSPTPSGLAFGGMVDGTLKENCTINFEIDINSSANTDYGKGELIAGGGTCSRALQIKYGDSIATTVTIANTAAHGKTGTPPPPPVLAPDPVDKQIINVSNDTQLSTLKPDATNPNPPHFPPNDIFLLCGASASYTTDAAGTDFAAWSKDCLAQAPGVFIAGVNGTLSQTHPRAFYEGQFKGVVASANAGTDYIVCSVINNGCNLTQVGITKIGGKIVTVNAFQGMPNPDAKVGADVLAGPTHATCEKGGFGLNWILCPIFNTVAGFCDWLFANLVQPLLRTAPISTSSSDPSFKIWSNFRIYGDIFLVIALLVVVFGQSLGGGLIDAYTAKKVLPRLLAAAILINLSIYIVAFMVDMTNIIGGGLGSLITAPLGGAGAFKISPSGVQAGLVAGFSGVGLVGAWGAAMLTSLSSVDAAAFIGLFVLLPAVLGLLAAIVTLILRKAIILALVLVSPVAFALYCLPNTEKYFHKWWELLLQTLMVYPIVIMVFAIADVLTVTLTKANPGALAGSLALIIAFILQFLPLLMIPYAFKMAGGAIGSLHGVLTGWGKKTTDAVKGDARDPNSLRSRVKHNYDEHRTRDRARVVDAGMRPGASRLRRARSRFANAMGGDVDAQLSRYNAEQHELSDRLSNTGRDKRRYDGAGYRLVAGQAAANGTTGFDGLAAASTAAYDRFFDSKGREINGTAFALGKQQHGHGASAIGQSLEYTLRKATDEKDIGNFRNAFAQNAIENNWDDAEAMDVWASATFGHKDKWRSEWYSSPKTIKGANGKTAGVQFSDVDSDTGSYDKMINEFHKVPASFQLSSTRAQDWKAMGSHIRDIQPKIAAGTATTAELERYAKTSEVLDTMTSRGLVTQSTEGDVIVQGANPETQGVISSIFKSRRYETTPEQTAPGVYSPTSRSLYDSAAVERLTKGVAATPTSPAILPITKQDAIHNTPGVIVASADVTGDRASIPRVIT